MGKQRVHSFHIPVMGLAFSIDTPVKVARYGISSVISIVDDILIEHMRKYHTLQMGETFIPMSPKEHDSRARRITAYLNLVHRIVQKQFAELKASAFEKGSEIVRYFELLADHSPLKAQYHRMLRTTDAMRRKELADELRKKIVPGDIDVNLLTKVDKLNCGPNGELLPPEFSDALAAIRGFARSDLNSSVVLSAGINPRLFTYMGELKEFLPDENGIQRKKVILKVSDYRSAIIQGKILAKKGIWVSEFRIESGLNCGGHAFATNGYLLGPILEEFKTQKNALIDELFGLFSTALTQKEIAVPDSPPEIRITVQGGIGTANEDAFLYNHYGVDGTGWGSPFLLVPEATNVDDETRAMLARAKEKDFYISNVSPLGVPFNNLRNTTSEQQVYNRAEEGKPGSPCVKKFLVANTEFTDDPICVASKQYQKLKLQQVHDMHLPAKEHKRMVGKILEKTCLCEDLAAPAYTEGMNVDEEVPIAVAICPGPNLAYFSRLCTLEEMIGHIYGRLNLITVPDRPNMFINELRLYVQHLKSEIEKRIDSLTPRDTKYFHAFHVNLNEGINYYKSLIPRLIEESDHYKERMMEALLLLEEELAELILPIMECVPQESQ
jgi:hypothetical protein